MATAMVIHDDGREEAMNVYPMQQVPRKAPGVVGSQATLDRVAAAEHPGCLVALTAELSVRFVAPVTLDHGAVIRAFVESDASHPLYNVHAELEQDQQLKARATAKFLVRGCV
jgi:acyl-coenzyme A thioesterase PaaI-like protein